MSTKDRQPPHAHGNVTPFPAKKPEDQNTPATQPASEPIINLPPGVKILSLLLTGIFLVQEFLLSPVAAGNIVMKWAFIPARYSGHAALTLADFLCPLTYMFFHGGWMHLFMNLGMLMAFGAGLEKALGWKKLLIIYFASGVIGALGHFAFMSGSDMPLIGASGGISGLFGAIIVILQQNNAPGQGLKALIPFVLIWVVSSVLFGMFGVPGSSAGIAWIVHIAGFLAGMALVRPVARLPLR